MTRFAVDAPTTLRLVREGIDPREHQLVGTKDRPVDEIAVFASALLLHAVEERAAFAVVQALHTHARFDGPRAQPQAQRIAERPVGIGKAVEQVAVF